MRIVCELSDKKVFTYVENSEYTKYRVHADCKVVGLIKFSGHNEDDVLRVIISFGNGGFESPLFSYPVEKFSRQMLIVQWINFC